MDSVRRRHFLFAFLVIGAVYAAVAGLTWRKWPDPIVDYGSQLYIPWKLSTGSVLYRDIGHIAGGPLSQYFDALLFKFFGVSFMTLVLANLLLVAVFVAVLYACFYHAADQLTAVTIGLGVVMVFVFAHRTETGIFNYITPYSTELVHGAMLSTCAVAALAKWLREEKIRLAAAAGFFCGLVFLTKPEVFLALAVSVFAALVLFWKMKRNSLLFFRPVAALLGAALIPIAAFLIYFWSVTDFSTACNYIVKGWIYVLTTKTAGNQFFRWGLGLTEPAAHLQGMFMQFFGAALIVALLVWTNLRHMPRIVLVLLVAALSAASWKFNWGNSGQALPLFCLALLALLLGRAKKSGLEPTAVFPILWTVFSLVLLLKLGLFSRIWHYGFVLAMPAFLSAIYLFTWLLPRELEHFNVHRLFMRGALWCPLMVGLAALGYHGLKIYPVKTLPLGEGADRMYVFKLQARVQDTAMSMALHWIETNTPPDSTVAVLPAGILLNYLARRTNPCTYTIWPPPEIASFGESTMTDDFIRHAPDYVLLLGNNYGEFGLRFFGMDKGFGQDLMKWIDAHYQPRALIGEDWLKNGRFGIKILQKTGAPEKTTAPGG